MTRNRCGHRTPPPAHEPSARGLWAAGILATLLMVFSIGMGLLGNDMLAGAAGVAAIALVGDIVRRLLGLGSPAAARSTPSYGPTPYEQTTSPEPAPARSALPRQPSVAGEAADPASGTEQVPGSPPGPAATPDSEAV